jgi:hypothetical protein
MLARLSKVTWICAAGVWLCACDVLNECTPSGSSWCDGSKGMTCVADDSGFGGGNHVETLGTCSDNEMCVDWKIQPDSSGAQCIAKNACSTAGSFCIDHSVTAFCFEGKELPQLNYCGDENFEGGNCETTSTGAACCFMGGPCSPEGAQKCFGESRFILNCVNGYWTELDSCLVGEGCFEKDDGGVYCDLRVRNSD